MRIIHLNDYDTTGAGIAAYRQHQALCLAGIDSQIIFAHHFCKKSLPNSVYLDTPDFPCHRYNGQPIHEILHRDLLIYYDVDPRAYAVFPSSDYDFLNHPLVRRADIINLHAVEASIDYSSFFPNVNKPIVWTLHDLNPVSSLFIYENDERAHASRIGDLITRVRHQKRQAMVHASDINVVAPSIWMYGWSAGSDLLGKYPHHLVPYSLDLEQYSPIDRLQARRQLGLPEKLTIFLFIAGSLSDHRKGFDLLDKCFQDPKLKNGTQFCAIGTRNEEQPIDNVQYTGWIDDESILRAYYSAADAFLLPSREDNLPNVMLESLACGTPVIGFRTGGISDAVIPKLTGILANEISAESFQSAMVEFQTTKFKYSSNKIRRFAEVHYNPVLQAKNYIRLYEGILSESRKQISEPTVENIEDQHDLTPSATIVQVPNTFKNFPKISVIVPLKKFVGWENNLTRSLKNQKYGNIELIVVADQVISSEQTLNPKFSFPVSLIYSNSTGFFPAINEGIKHAKGEWLYFIGADDAINSREVFQNLMRYAKPGLKILYGKIHSEILGKAIGSRQSADTLNRENIPLASVLYKREVFSELGLFNTEFKIWADWDKHLIWIREGRKSAKFVNLIIARCKENGHRSWQVDHTFIYKLVNYGHIEFFERLKRISNCWAIYGTGQMARRIVDLARRYGIPLPQIIIDKDKNIKELEGIPVVDICSQEVLGVRYIVLGSEIFRKEMKDKIESNHPDPIRIEIVDLFDTETGQEVVLKEKEACVRL